jgi:hypothetical protein
MRAQRRRSLHAGPLPSKQGALQSWGLPLCTAAVVQEQSDRSNIFKLLRVHPVYDLSSAFLDGRSISIPASSMAYTSMPNNLHEASDSRDGVGTYVFQPNSSLLLHHLNIILLLRWCQSPSPYTVRSTTLTFHFSISSCFVRYCLTRLSRTSFNPSALV